ncbi:MAG: hypothetical protein ACRETQ_05890 [Gammaproteobacteria bacterium]
MIRILSSGSKWQPWWIVLAVLAVLAATALAYMPGLSGDFMFDDIPNIVRNPAFPPASLSPHVLLNIVFSSRSGLLYRPLSMLSFALNEYFFGLGPYSFKLTNVLIHLANALLILWLSWRLIVNCRRRYGFKWSDRIVAWASVLTAAAWALHPLNLTAVLYIVQRMTSLAALFTLAGILSYLYGRERQLAGKSGWPLVWLLTPFFGILGVLSKEDAALLPLYLLVIEWLIFGFRSAAQAPTGLPAVIPAQADIQSLQKSGPLLTETNAMLVPPTNQSFVHRRHARNIIVFYLVGLVLPGLVGIAYLVHQHFWTGFAGRDFTLPERVLTEFRVVFLYIKWTFIPDIRELALYHDDLAVSTGLLHPVTTLLSLLALVAILLLGFSQRRRRPLLCLGILWFFAGQMMESTVLPLELAFEHRNYLPDYGLILAFFSLLLLPAAPVAKPKVRRSLRWTIAVIILPVLFGVTLLRSWEWRNPLSFAYYEAHHHPRSQRAVYALGQAYSDLALRGALQNPELAISTLDQAAAVSNNIMPDVAAMIVRAKLGLPPDAINAQHATWLLQNRAFTAQDTASLFSLVMCLPKSCAHLAVPAGELITTALHPHAGDKNATRSPDLWTIYAQYLTFTGQPLHSVIEAMQHAVTLGPKVPQYRVNLIKALIVAGNFGGAEQQIDELRKLNFLGHLDVDIQDLNRRLADAQAKAAKPPDKTPAAKT